VAGLPVTWRDGVTITVRAALSAATSTYGIWDSSLWDSGLWGPDIVWTDISSDVRSFKTDRTFNREVQWWNPGTASIVLNNRHGNYSPSNLSGPYVTGGITQIRPLRPIQILATYAGTTYYLYTGYATDWDESWLPGPGTGKGDAIVTVPCVDELARLAAFTPTALGSAVGTGETTGLRIQRLLNAAGHTGARAIDVGTNTVQGTVQSANIATELQATVQAEGGGFFVDADGTVVFEKLYALMENSRSNTVQGTFGDLASSGELRYADAHSLYNADLVSNMASFAREGTGTTPQTAADNTSRALYGDRQEARTDFVNDDDTDLQSLATFWVARFKDPEQRFTDLQIKPRRDPTNLYPQVLGRRVRDLVQVKRRPPGGYTISQPCHISGIHHSVTPDRWDTTFDLWSATVYQLYAQSRWDAGVWDSAAWFF
jgi:hypothetical protein